MRNHPVIRLLLGLTLVFTLLLTLSLPLLAQADFNGANLPMLNQAAVDESAGGQTLTLRQNEDLTITLSSNDSTGFSWHLTDPGDAGVLVYVDDYYTPPASGVPGAPGHEVWTFRADKAGSTSITLAYYQTWNPNTDQTFTLNVNVLSYVPASSPLSAILITAGLAMVMAAALSRFNTRSKYSG